MANAGYTPIVPTASATPVPSGYTPITAAKAPASVGYQLVTAAPKLTPSPIGINFPSISNSESTPSSIIAPKQTSPMVFPVGAGLNPEQAKQANDVVNKASQDIVGATQIKFPFMNAGVDVPNTPADNLAKGIVEWPERVVDTLQQAGQINKTGTYTPDDPNKEYSIKTPFDEQSDMRAQLLKEGTDPIQAEWIAGLYAGSSAILDLTGLADMLSKGALGLAKGIVPEESTQAALELLGNPSTPQEAETAYRNIAHIAHPDLPSGNSELMKQANDAISIIRKEGIPNAYNARSVIANHIKNTARQSDLGSGFLTPDLLPESSTPSLESTPQISRELLPGYRPMNPDLQPIGLFTQEVEPVGFGEKPAPYEGETDLTTNILQKLEGRTTVSKQFISDLTNSAELKQPERDTVRTVLESYPDDKPIPVADFASKVKAELLPLKVNSSDKYSPDASGMDPEAMVSEGNFTPKYENITLPAEARGDVANYKESIYESPVATSAGDVHFNYHTKNYFGHTRVEDMADNSTRRIIEVQSDLYQKGNLEREEGPTNSRSLSDLTTEERDATLKASGEARAKEIAPLKQYSNPTAHFRMVREEIKQAALDGKTKLQFPTGETAMKIEGLGEFGGGVTPWAVKKIGSHGGPDLTEKLSPENMKVGMEINRMGVAGENGNWIITDVLGDGKFKAMPKNYYEALKGQPENTIEAFTNGHTETFDISGKINTSDPIYRFYEKDLGRYLTNKYGAKVITDKQGVKWYELNVPKSAAKAPVTAFKAGTKVNPTGGPVAPKAEVEAMLRKIFSKKEIDIAFTKNLIDGKAVGRYTGAHANIVDGIVKPLIKLVEEDGKVPLDNAYHEAFHAYVDNFADPEEWRGILDRTKKDVASALSRGIKTFDGYTGGASQRAEEFLADDFAQYVKDETGYTGKNEGFWSRLLNKIRDFIRRVTKAGKLYDDILSGKRVEEAPILDTDNPQLAYKMAGEDEEPLNDQVPTFHPNPMERRLEELLTERDMHQEAIDANPAKQLSRYANHNGELPEVLGDQKGGKFNKTGDELTADLGFPDSESARLAYQNYKLQLRRVLDLNERISNLRKDIVASKAEDRDAKSLGAILERAAKKTDKQVTAMEKALEHPETDAELKARKEAATERMINILRKTYGTVPHLERETPAWMLQATEKSYNITQAEHEAMGLGDPTKPGIFVDDSTPLKQRIAVIDYFRTPDRVLKKIGLGESARELRRGYENYLSELPLHLDLIREWKRLVPSAEGNLRIFKYLDGQQAKTYHMGGTYVPLSREEMVVAKQIKEYLRQWADRLGLPADNKISHYITHIFGLSGNEKEFDEELAKVIRNKVPGSVYDPFLEKRLGTRGYLEDTWKALDAYAKRAVRKANMDPALKRLKEAVMDDHGNPKVEVSIYNYVKRYGDSVNMRPTEWDTLLDNQIKQLVGYKFGGRPTAFLTGTMRRWVSRSLLGANLNNAVKNLTQGVNTFAKLGPKYTTIGYAKLMTTVGSQEFADSGLMRQNIAQDKTVSAVNNVMQKLDTGLYALHTLAEYINRGAAYWGAKSKALDEGMSELKAIDYARRMGRDTQFNYGSIDTPLVVSGDIAKTLLQFGSYPMKQTEFLAEMFQKKEWANIIKYILGVIVVVNTLGRLFNIKASDFFPLSYFAPSQVGGVSVTKFVNPPALALPESILGAVMALPGSADPTKGPRGGKSALQKTGESVLGNIPFPASLQAKKTYQFFNSVTTPKKTSKKNSGLAF